MKNQKMIMGMVIGAAVVVGGLYLMNRRKNGSIAKTANDQEGSEIRGGSKGWNNQGNNPFPTS